MHRDPRHPEVANPAGRAAVVLVLLGSLVWTLAAASGTPQVVQTRRALDFLGDEAVDWQQRFDCSGCHKQSITLAALTRGRASGHDGGGPGVFETLMDGMLAGDSGQDADGCFSLRGQSSFTMATSFGGRGLEAWDRFRGSDRRTNLTAAADCLVDRQDPGGRLAADHSELPVAQGDFVGTAHGVFTWERAHQVSGDAAYRAAADQAVAWLRGEVAAVEAAPASFTTQDKAMLLAGLGRAGATPADPDVTRVRDVLAAEQLADGSFKLRESQTGGNAHATGQVAFALLTAGHDRTDTTLDPAVAWLLDTQAADGSWAADHWEGGAPSALAPSMWGGLALAMFPSPLATLRVDGGAAATISWDSVDGADAYDVIRGNVGDLVELSDRVDLGIVDCLAAAQVATSVADAAVPAAGQAFYYVMRIRWGADHDIWGRSSEGRDRVPTGGECPP